MRPGYKQTEVGVIPEDWEFLRLTSIADIRDGTHESPRYIKSGVPFVTSKNIVSGKFDFENIAFISEDDAREVNRRSKVDRNDILLSMIGTVGNAALVDFDPQFCIKNVALIKPTPSSVDSRFLIQVFRSDRYAKYIDNKLDGGIQKFISLGVLRNLGIPIPPAKAEQAAIAEALSDADALIESQEQLIAKKRQIKQGAMQELLTGKKRLPGFSGEWELKRLDSVAEIFSGGTPSTNRPEFWDGDILWCTPTDITALNGTKYLSQTARTITSEGLKASAAGLLPAFSIVMTSRATIGECAINTVPVATNQGFKNFVPFLETDGEFLYYLLQTKKQEFIGLCSGSTFLEIGKTQLASFEVGLPSEKAEQAAIATILSDMDAELTTLETKLAKTRQLKQGMMQELLTGRIRLL